MSGPGAKPESRTGRRRSGELPRGSWLLIHRFLVGHMLSERRDRSLWRGRVWRCEWQGRFETAGGEIVDSDRYAANRETAGR